MVTAAGWFGRLDLQPSSRGLSVLYLVGGMLSLFVYLLPDMEGTAAMLGIVISIWQGFLLWRGRPGRNTSA